MPSPKRKTSTAKKKVAPKKKAPARKRAPAKKAAPSKPSSPITADIAERLLRADLANIVRKVKSGKTLTAQERRTLQAASDGDDDATAPAFVKNYTELAEILGVTRRTLQDWRKMEGAPQAASNGEHDVAAWQDFQRRIGGKGAAQPEDTEAEDGLPTEPILKRRKLLLFCREKEMQLAEKRGELIDVALVRATWAKKCAAANSLLRKRLENELPSELEGMEAADIYEELVKVVDEFNEVMSSGDSAGLEEEGDA
jgi:phage terminase Nu1 subunit (DNA packaging protein)